MRFTWWVWVIGVVIIGLAGFVAALAPRRQAQERVRGSAWRDAQAAIAAAGVSRDAAPVAVPAAEKLLLQAELLSARHGGPASATEAAGLARDADKLWRAAFHG